VFDLDEDGCVVLLQPRPDESLRRAVDNAAGSCPTRSIHVSSD
jgi:ferredoxin